MTPEEIAKQIVDDYIISRSMDDRELEDAIVAALRAERERAAKIVETGFGLTIEQIAARIRALD